MSDIPSSQELGTIQKVTLEYENGFLTVEGEDAVKWKALADGQASLAYVHGAKYAAPNWTFAPKEK